jgi:hypothetical protein
MVTMASTGERDLETINGYTVVAERPSGRPAERVILAVRADTWPSGFEYVVARAGARWQATYWDSGDYTGTFAEAVEAFNER